MGIYVNIKVTIRYLFRRNNIIHSMKHDRFYIHNIIIL